MRLFALASLLFLAQGLLVPTNALEPLQGGVQHSQALPAVPAYLSTGTQFSEQLLPPSGSDSSWYQIPNWAAGDWKRFQVKKRMFLLVPVTVKDEAGGPMGHQTDAKGGIWHWKLTPYKSRSEQASTVTISFCAHDELLHVSNQSICTRSVFTAWVVDKYSGMVRSVYQGEQLDTQYPVSPGVMRNDYSLAEYTEYGQFVRKSKGTWDWQLIGPYKPVSECRGQDLRKLFVSYLFSRELYDRIPRSEDAHQEKSSPE